MLIPDIFKIVRSYYRRQLPLHPNSKTQKPGINIIALCRKDKYSFPFLTYKNQKSKYTRYGLEGFSAELGIIAYAFEVVNNRVLYDNAVLFKSFT